jgi:phosphoglycolate phosphatase-like HAD superfamily hydrolase
LIKAVIFDLDGTLVHLPIDYEALLREFGKIMKTENIRPLTKTVPNLDEKTRREIFEVWASEELAALPRITADEEGLMFYEKFCKEQKALVTMQGKALVKNVLERFRLSFDVVLTREDSLDRTVQLKTAAEKLGVQLRSVLFVGNEDKDRLAAKEVGCQFLKVGR